MEIKLDMEKAYDRLDWKFSQKCCMDLGFSKKWTNWIMGCIKTTSFSILVNGIPCKPFKLERGIR